MAICHRIEEISMFRYQRLDEALNEIRVVTIWPGRFDDPIKIDISHYSLVPPPVDKNSSLVSIEDIKKTLPEESPWDVFTTLEGRTIFINNDTDETSWSHPDPLVGRSLYDRECAPENNKAQPAYEALSYTWGPEIATSPLSVEAIGDGTEPSYQGLLCIGQNLDEALRYLRYPHSPRTMWIDALSIDQSDIEERNHEVKRMGDIFRLAKRVIAWIGPAFEGSTFALSTLKDIAQNIVWKSNRACKARPGCSDPSWHKCDIPPQFNTLTEITIGNLFSRHWFRRLWVVQEIHLSSPSSIVQCGRETILWTDLQGAAMILISKHDDGTKGRLQRHLWEMARICFYTKGTKLDDLFWKYHDLGCQLPHDRIYGLMNLAPLGWTSRIEPDYSKSVLEVYREAFLEYSRFYGRLDLLLRTGVNGIGTVSCDENWPSWVPDWTARALDTIPPGNGFSAASFSPSHSALHGPNELEVAGIILDTITYVYRLDIKSFQDLADYFNELDLEKIMEKRYRTGELFLDAHLHVVTHSRFKERVPHVGRPEFEHVREHIINLAQGRESPYDLTQYENDMMVGLEDSYCFLTSDGYLGHCRTRGTVEKGDQVFIPLGCPVPILVRPTFNNKHRSLGDCFVHGVMHGETLLGSLPPNYSVQEIKRSDGITRTHFLNHDTGEHTMGDPRLVPIPFPKGWLFLRWGMEIDDPTYCPLFVHETGRVVPHDPRLEMCALIERGVNVQTVTLV